MVRTLLHGICHGVAKYALCWTRYHQCNPLILNYINYRGHADESPDDLHKQADPPNALVPYGDKEYFCLSLLSHLVKRNPIVVRERARMIGAWDRTYRHYNATVFKCVIYL